MNSHNLTQQLEEAFPIKIEIPFCAGLSIRFVLSNDQLTGCDFDTVSGIEKSSDLFKDKKKLTTALLIGESNILSLVDKLSEQIRVDTVILADIDPLVLKHVQHQISCLHTASSIEEYKNNYLASNTDNYLTDHIFGENSNIKSKENALLLQEENSGKYFFLSSEENFRAAKLALEKTTIICIQVDIFDQNKVTLLKNQLNDNNYQIVYINLTNLAHYKSNPSKLYKFAESIKEICNDCCLVQYSHGGFLTLIKTHLTIIEEYENYLHKNYPHRFLASSTPKSSLDKWGFFDKKTMDDDKQKNRVEKFLFF